MATLLNNLFKKTHPMSTSDRIILGLTGHPSCGKDTIAEWFIEHRDFAHISTSDLLREYIQENNLGGIDRENMSAVGTRLRAEKGPDFLVKQALERNASAKLIISGIRALPEAEAIQRAGGKILVVTAPLEVRYERAKQRGRIGDDVSFEAFVAIEEKESSNSNPNAQNVNAIAAMADIVINNDKTLEDLYQTLESLHID